MRPIHPKYQDIDVTNCYRYERCTMKTLLEHTAPSSLPPRKLIYEIVHVTQTPEQLKPIENVDYHEVRATNGNGHRRD